MEERYAKTLTDEEFEKALHPEVYAKLKREGFAEFIGAESSYFVMDSNRTFNEPGILINCYAHGICNNQPTNNNTLLCKDCVKLFIRNGTFMVDLIDSARCDDCAVRERSIRVLRSNRQLCMTCFKRSLDRIQEKKNADKKSSQSK